MLWSGVGVSEDGIIRFFCFCHRAPADGPALNGGATIPAAPAVEIRPALQAGGESRVEVPLISLSPYCFQPVTIDVECGVERQPPFFGHGDREVRVTEGLAKEDIARVLFFDRG